MLGDNISDQRQIHFLNDIVDSHDRDHVAGTVGETFDNGSTVTAHGIEHEDAILGSLQFYYKNKGKMMYPETDDLA